MNKLSIEGQVVNDVKFMDFETSSLCKLTIAVRNPRKVKDEWLFDINFFDVDLWNPEFELRTDLATGDTVEINGRLSQERWVNKETGVKNSKVKIIGRELTIVSKAVPSGAVFRGEDVA